MARTTRAAAHLSLEEVCDFTHTFTIFPRDAQRVRLSVIDTSGEVASSKRQR
jgi:hypothetical protein